MVAGRHHSGRLRRVVPKIDIRPNQWWFIAIRFYKVKSGEDVIELSTASDTDDGTLKPEETDNTETTDSWRADDRYQTGYSSCNWNEWNFHCHYGAQFAVIGAAFADKEEIERRSSGTWEGAGLNALDQLCKANR